MKTKQRAWRWLTSSQRLEVRRRVGIGESNAEIAQAVGCSRSTVSYVVKKSGGVKARPRPRAKLRLSLPEREEISRGLVAGESYRTIAVHLGRSPSTISREVAANGTRRSYRSWRADARAEREAARPKPAKLLEHRRLRAEVERGLRKRWSPAQIAMQLVRDFPRIWRCACRLRRSISRSLCRVAARSDAS